MGPVHSGVKFESASPLANGVIQQASHVIKDVSSWLTVASYLSPISHAHPLGTNLNLSALPRLTR
jgi:hypothetical protein